MWPVVVDAGIGLSAAPIREVSAVVHWSTEIEPEWKSALMRPVPVDVATVGSVDPIRADAFAAEGSIADQAKPTSAPWKRLDSLPSLGPQAPAVPRQSKALFDRERRRDVDGDVDELPVDLTFAPWFHTRQSTSCLKQRLPSGVRWFSCHFREMGL